MAPPRTIDPEEPARPTTIWLTFGLIHAADQRAKALGISRSEYLRRLLLRDLDGNLFGMDAEEQTPGV